MSPGELTLHPADALYELVSYGRWRTRLELERHAESSAWEVEAGLHFLEKYGFVESSFVKGEKQFRAIKDAPRPSDAVDTLLSLDAA